jgi:hypothetical protein
VPPIPEELRRRAGALTLAAGALALLVLALVLRPAGEGHGTHTQLGLPSCGWVVAFDRPCPTCGMTTSYAHAARGDLLTAAATQPMGTLLALVTASVFWAGLHVAATGCRTGRLVPGLLSPRTLWVAAGLTALAWVYKLLTW